MHRLSLVLLLGFLVGTFSARAQDQQNQIRVEIYAFQADAFPTMRLGLDVYDRQGLPIPGLTADQMVILEDNQPRPLLDFKEEKPGVHFIIALNAGAEFARRDAQGVSRYSKVIQSLLDWLAKKSGANLDDLSLVTNFDVNVAHLSNQQDLGDLLAATQPALYQLTPTVDTLARALAIARDPPQPEMKSAILFISAPASPTEFTTLQSLGQSAASRGIRIYTWIVTSTAYVSSSGATVLKDLAIQTNGQFFTFSGQEALPSIESYLAPLRCTYRLSYSSAITSAGSHQVIAAIVLDQERYPSPPLSFELDVQPPNPMLVLPPSGQIVRRSADPDRYDASLLLPTEQELEAIIEFPDGHPRPLVRTALYVDGQVVDENTNEPWEVFSWDLTSYTSSGQHLLQVEAVDSLGLSRRSAEAPMIITVVKPPAGWRGWVRRNVSWLISGVVLMAGLFLIAILRSDGREKTAPVAARKGREVLAQPVPTKSKPATQKLKRRPRGSPPASLIRLNEAGQPITARPIFLEDELTFGSDPTKSEVILDDPSVSPLHARIKPSGGDDFLIQDEHSIAGTWVNFEMLAEPRVLRHGDIIHIGRFSYRFLLSHRSPSSPRILPQ